MENADFPHGASRRPGQQRRRLDHLGNPAILGGLALEFYHRVYVHYGRDDAWKHEPREKFHNRGQHGNAVDPTTELACTFEPRVAEAVFDALVREAVAARHRDWQFGLVWPLQNHPRIPEAVRQRHAAWGRTLFPYALPSRFQFTLNQDTSGEGGIRTRGPAFDRTRL